MPKENNYVLCYCNVCKKETHQRTLKQLSFLQQCLVAAITKCGVDLTEPEYECNNCGTKH